MLQSVQTRSSTIVLHLMKCIVHFMQHWHNISITWSWNISIQYFSHRCYGLFPIFSSRIDHISFPTYSLFIILVCYNVAGICNFIIVCHAENQGASARSLLEVLLDFSSGTLFVNSSIFKRWDSGQLYCAEIINVWQLSSTTFLQTLNGMTSSMSFLPPPMLIGWTCPSFLSQFRQVILHYRLILALAVVSSVTERFEFENMNSNLNSWPL